MKRRFKQVDVFGNRPFMGNPVAVILDGQGLSDLNMASIATWTNLSETTFVLPPERSGDYRIRIFTPQGELPFAGHPTLGTAHAFLESSGARDTSAIQECGIGLVPVTTTAGPAGVGRMLSFEAPPVSATELPPSTIRDLANALGLAPTPVPKKVLVMDVGPRWCVFDLSEGDVVARLEPDMGLLAVLSRQLNLTGVTVFGRFGEREPSQRVRSFAPAAGVPEDPACGSGNACVAAFLATNSRVPANGMMYTAVQGQEIGRDARLMVRVSQDGSRIDIAGRTITIIDGVIEA